jgi:hypothetical protein
VIWGRTEAACPHAQEEMQSSINETTGRRCTQVRTPADNRDETTGGITGEFESTLRTAVSLPS